MGLLFSPRIILSGVHFFGRETPQEKSVLILSANNPNDGNLDWSRIFKAMRGIRGDCDLVLEYCPGTPVSKLRKSRKIIIKEVLEQSKYV
jgi:hypothetical protein